jgi:hypothetical protein
MRAAKELGCEALYQLMAASIASWFRRRNIRDVNIDLRLDSKNPYEPPQLNIKEIIEAQQKFKHFVGDIEYPQMVYYQQQQALQ